MSTRTPRPTRSGRNPHDDIANRTPSNSKQDHGKREANRAQTSGKPATTRQNTITAGNDRADGVVKSSQSPLIGTGHHGVKVPGPHSFPRDHGK